ncbi:MAG: hypothetical protein K2J10_00195 [Muribaculaceae bacterium]|nr:hypothetical protein [Muribaculaceae bacterium]
MIIDERPENWDALTPSYFKMDTIVGKGDKGAIVILVERNTSFTFAHKLLEGKNAKDLAEMMHRISQQAYQTIYPKDHRL